MGIFASTCPFPFSQNSISDRREFYFRFSVKPLCATQPRKETAPMSFTSVIRRWGIGSTGEGGGIPEIQGIGRDEWLKDKKLDFLKQKDYH